MPDEWVNEYRGPHLEALIADARNRRMEDTLGQLLEALIRLDGLHRQADLYLASADDVRAMRLLVAAEVLPPGERGNWQTRLRLLPQLLAVTVPGFPDRADILLLAKFVHLANAPPPLQPTVQAIVSDTADRRTIGAAASSPLRSRGPGVLQT